MEINLLTLFLCALFMVLIVVVSITVISHQKEALVEEREKFTEIYVRHNELVKHTQNLERELVMTKSKLENEQRMRRLDVHSSQFREQMTTIAEDIHEEADGVMSKMTDSLKNVYQHNASSKVTPETNYIVDESLKETSNNMVMKGKLSNEVCNELKTA